MTILWRYCLHSYLKVLTLSILSFIALLFIARFKEIASFTALTEDFVQTGLFAVYQIPLILPIAIPISALITSLFVFQLLSRTHELTAMRALGSSLTSILAPFLLTAILLSFLNFSICASLAPYCRRASKALLCDKTTHNPLLLLKLQKAYMSSTSRDEEKVENLLLIARHRDRLNLVSARQLFFKNGEITGSNVGLISYVPSTPFDTLVIENEKKIQTPATFLSDLLKKNSPKLDIGSLSFNKLSDTAEICRRISLSIAPFTFTLLGCAFGIEQRRSPSRKNLLAACALSLCALLCYFLTKTAPYLSLGVHPFLSLLSTLHLRRIARGQT